MKEHLPVLLHELLTALEGRSIARFIDATVGAGGHSEEILKAHPEVFTAYLNDRDLEALALAKEVLAPWQEKLVWIHGNFSDLFEREIPPCQLLLADLGVSSMQLDRSERGFSFSRSGPLDMRMDTSKNLTAADVVNGYTESALTEVMWRGEVPAARSIARRIVENRERKPFQTTQELVDLLYGLCKNANRRSPIHPLTLVFQALRMEVNGELSSLEAFLKRALDSLEPGGLLAVISFHSLEDRLVKQFMRYESDDKESTEGRGGVFLDKQPTLKVLTRKPITATEEEMIGNPRARSAKMRIAEKL